MKNQVSKENLKSAKRRAIISIGLNIVLAIGKGVAGVLSGSTALLGDAINSATDVLASSAVFVGLWVAGREHPSFPYGLYKAETIAILITSVAVILAGYEIGRQAIFGVTKIIDVSIALPVALVSFLISLGFGILQMRAGKKLDSPALEADARDYLADSLCTSVVLVGLFASSFGYNVDRIAAGVVSLFVFYAGGHLMLSALKDLLDASIDRETEREIINMVENHPRIHRVKKCLSRVTGGRFIVDMDVEMRTPSHKLADFVADRLEEDIPQQFPKVVMARIRPHYSRGEFIRRVTPVDLPDGRRVDHMTTAPWFLVETVRVSNGKVERRKFIENKYKDAVRRKGLLVGRWLLTLKPDELVAEDNDSTPITILKEAGVDIVEG